MKRQVPMVLLCALAALCVAPARAQTAATRTKSPTGTEFPELIIQAGHSREVKALAFSADGKLLASSGDDTSTRIWDPRNGRLLRVMHGQASMPQFAPGGGKLVSVGGVWDLKTGQLLREFDNGGSVRAPFALTPDGKIQAVSDNDGGLFLREVETGKVTVRIQESKSCFVGRFTPDGRSLLVYQEDSGFQIRDVASLAIRDVLVPLSGSNALAQGWVFSVAENGQRVAFVSYDSERQRSFIHIWDLVLHREIRQAEVPQNAAIWQLQFSPDGRWIGSASNDGRAFFHEIGSGKLLFTLPGGQSGASSYDVRHFAFRPCEKHGAAGFCENWNPIVATSGKDDAVRFWDLSSGRQLFGELPRAAEVKSLDVSLDRRSLTTGDSVGGASVWDLSNGSRIAEVKAEGERILSPTVFETISSVAFHPSGKWLAWLAPDQSIHFWDILRGDSPHPSLKTNGSAMQVSVTPDGNWLIVGGVEPFIFRQNLAYTSTQKQSRTSNLLDPAPGQTESGMKSADFRSGFSLSFSANGKLMAHGSLSRYVGLWDAAEWRKLREIRTDFPRILNVALSPDGRWLFTANWSEDWMELRDLTSRMEDFDRRGFTGDRGAIQDAKFSPDGKWLALAELESVAVWNVEDGTLLRRFGHSNSYLNRVAFLSCPEPATNGVCSTAPDYLFAAAEDGATYLWDFPSGTLLARLYSFADRPDWLVITPDGLFDGTPWAWRNMLWRFRGELLDVAPVEMFFNEYYRPGLLSELLSGERPKAPQDISGVDRRVPTVALQLLTTASRHPITERQVTLRVAVKESPADPRHNRGSGARDLRVFRNGALVKHWPNVPLPSNSGTASLELTVPIVAGDNRFTAYAFNRENVKSEDAELNLQGAKNLERPPVAHVLAVGVSQYANPEFNLTFAHTDAERFASVMDKEARQLGTYSRIQVTKLRNEEATKKNILAALRQLANTAQPEDSVFLFFSGHGSAAGPRFYFVPYDLGYQGYRDPLSPDGLAVIQRNSVSDLDLQRELERLDAGTIVLVIDACNSGQALEAPELDPSKPIDLAAERLRRQLFYRGPINAKGLGQLAYEKGIFVLTAAQSYQAAVEVKRQGSGLLTYALMSQALEERKAARVSGGQVLLTDWLAYPVQQVPELQKEVMVEEQENNKSISFVDDTRLPPEQRGLQRPRIFYRREAEVRAPIVAGVKRDH